MQAAMMIRASNNQRLATDKQVNQYWVQVSQEEQNHHKWNMCMTMDLVHYSFAPLILFRAPYMLNLLPYYQSIANGAGGVGIFELLIFQCYV